MKYFFIALAILSLVAIGPLLTIWSLNVLFPILAIKYSLESWFAVVILGGLFTSIRKTK
jgi:hypothetical protein